MRMNVQAPREGARRRQRQFFGQKLPEGSATVDQTRDRERRCARRVQQPTRTQTHSSYPTQEQRGGFDFGMGTWFFLLLLNERIRSCPSFIVCPCSWSVWVRSRQGGNKMIVTEELEEMEVREQAPGEFLTS